MTRLLRSCRSFVALIVFVGTCACSAQDLIHLPEESLPGLEGFLTEATRNAPRLLNAADEIAQIDHSAVVYRSALYPKASGALNWNYLSEERSDGLNTRNDKLYYSFVISQPLFHWGALRASARIGKLDQRVGRLRLLQTANALANEIRAGYIGLITLKLSLRNARFELQRAQRAYDAVMERAEANQAAPIEVTNHRRDREHRSIAADRAELNYRSAREAFARLIGVAEVRDEDVPVELPRPPTHDQEQLAAATEADDSVTPAVRLSALELERERTNYSIIRTNLRPKFSLTGGVYQDRASYEANAPTVNSTYIGLSLNWSLFDGFATRAQKKASLVRQRSLERMLSSAKVEARAGAERALADLDLAARSLALGEEHWVDAQAGFHQGEIDHAGGLISKESLDAARAGLYAAELANIHARADYWLACARFLSLVNADPVAERFARISSR